jgi:hypothetical protein
MSGGESFTAPEESVPGFEEPPAERLAENALHLHSIGLVNRILTIIERRARKRPFDIALQEHAFQTRQHRDRLLNRQQFNEIVVNFDRPLTTQAAINSLQTVKRARDILSRPRQNE